MQFKKNLLKGRLIQRYKRFLADIELDNGEKITAHCANTGSMLGCKKVGARVLVSPAENPDRKLKYTWEIVYVGRTPVCINTSSTNQIVFEAIQEKKIPELASYTIFRREVKYGEKSRIDILLENEANEQCFVEVKNVTLAESNVALFPDAVTLRGQKHIEELEKMVKKGHRGVLFFLVQRNDVRTFTPAKEIDPEYDRKLKKAVKKGVEVYVYKSKISPTKIILGEQIPLVLQ